jgi:hypothetical protein
MFFFSFQPETGRFLKGGGNAGMLIHYHGPAELCQNFHGIKFDCVENCGIIAIISTSYTKTE